MLNILLNDIPPYDTTIITCILSIKAVTPFSYLSTSLM